MNTNRLESKRVAFQGERGAFSEEAAIKLLGEEIELVPCHSFEDLFRAVPEGNAEFALAPIENSLAGSVHRSYDLLLEGSLHMISEVIIPISHCLIGCSGSSFEDITQAESHPVALAQCEVFFAEHPRIQRIVASDTAGSVASIVERREKRHAAIAGRRAAEVYGGVILKEHLEDHRENYTRFVLLASEPSVAPGSNKLSLVVKLSHKPGALASALNPFAVRNIDLLKIESRPVHGRPWQYHFYLDLRGSISDQALSDALGELNANSDEVRLLGCYPSADTNIE